MSIFSYVLHLKGVCAFETPAYDEVYQQIHRMFTNSAELAIDLGIDTRKYDRARYAVCAWSDEMLSTMSWSHNRRWLNHTLQNEIYDSLNPNTEFYTRLSALKADDSAVRQIFLYCLYLGYRGQYLLESDKPLLSQLTFAHLISLVDRKSLTNSVYETSIFRDAYPFYVPGNKALAQITPRAKYLPSHMVEFSKEKKLNRSIIYRSCKGEQHHNQNNCKNELQIKVKEFNRQWNCCIAQVKKTLQKDWAHNLFTKNAWYIVIGDKGQGKTSLLQASEALNPIVDYPVNSNRIGANPLGFWLMRDSIIFDILGELIE